MIRQILKQIVIAKPVRALSSSSNAGKLNFEVKINQQNETFEFHDTEVETASKKQKKYEFALPFVWLRDNCQCDVCYHAQSSSRTINWENFDVAVKPKKFQFDATRKVFEVTWNDNDEHKSVFDYEWLMSRNFSSENRERYLTSVYRPKKRLWAKKDFADVLKHFDFKKIIEDDHELHDWLSCLSINGIAIIKNTPQTELEARKIADRVGFIRRTHYGEEFMVKAKEGTSNVAYLSAPLQMHTDLPYYDYAPGVNLLHCLVQSKSSGAQNLISDAFYVANLMKEEFPTEFKALSTILVNWTDIGREETGPPFHSINRAPMFCHGYDGQIERINHSIPQRDSFFTVPLSDVKVWYKALAKFVELIHREAVEFKTVEGEILCFDNIRLIHGRKKYEDVEGNSRHIVGAYLDWDEIFSRLRVLQKELKGKV